MKLKQKWRRDLSVLPKLKRPTIMGAQEWRFLEDRGYVKTLEKFGKEGKVTLTVQDIKNLDEMQKVHKNPENGKQREENQRIRDIANYYLTLRELYYTHDVGRHTIQKISGISRQRIARDFKKVNWKTKERKKER